MIRVDKRVGSGPYAKALRRLGPPDLEVDLTTLDFGDVAFLGHGPSGSRDLRIGVEIKQLSDFLLSLLNGRLVAHQLPGMLDAYDRCYLLLTGTWRPGTDGSLERPYRHGWNQAGFGGHRWTYGAFVRTLTSFQEQAGVPVLRATSKTEAAHMLLGIYEWWQTPWKAHTTLRGFHTTPVERLQLTKPSLLRTMAAQIPEVGWELSYACEQTFVSIEEMMGAPACVWANLRPPGMTKAGNQRARIGEKRAARIVAALQGRR